MGISKTTAKYILMLLGILIFLGSYLLVYMDYTTKTDTLNSEIKELKVRLDTLSGYELNQVKYTDGISNDKALIGDMLSRYSSSAQPEDFIMLATDLENNVGLSATSLSFDSPEPFYTIVGVTDGANNRTPVSPLQLLCFRISSTINTTMDYEQMKQALDHIAALKDVTKLNSLNMTYDSSTGLITGDYILEKYYITGRDVPEHETEIPFTELGKDILIGG